MGQQKKHVAVKDDLMSDEIVAAVAAVQRASFFP